jgi:hypothetical protein
MTAGETLQLPETKMVQTHGKHIFLSQPNMFSYLIPLELTCGIHVRFQIRDVPGPKTVSASDFDTYASESTTIVFILDVTVRITF